jgi:hypothetical protein
MAAVTPRGSIMAGAIMRKYYWICRKSVDCENANVESEN